MCPSDPQILSRDPQILLSVLVCLSDPQILSRDPQILLLVVIIDSRGTLAGTMLLWYFIIRLRGSLPPYSKDARAGSE